LDRFVFFGIVSELKNSGKRHQFDIAGKNGSHISFVTNPFMPGGSKKSFGFDKKKNNSLSDQMLMHRFGILTLWPK
jgi:hypothetical protein